MTFQNGKSYIVTHSIVIGYDDEVIELNEGDTLVKIPDNELNVINGTITFELKGNLIELDDVEELEEFIEEA